MIPLSFSLAIALALVVSLLRPEDSRHFRAEDSSTFVAQTSQTFDLNYADGSHLRGFSGVDQIYMGDYKATSPFGLLRFFVFLLFCLFSQYCA